MAASLSRALKLPGKKGSDLGEYDPLTQADSEDETEDDDLVLNYPRNGLNPAVADLRGEEELDEEEELREGAGHEVGPGRSQGGAAEEKAARVRGAMRSAAFLLPLSCAALLVLLCAFLIPCPQGALLQMQWERELGDTAGVTSPPIALWDVDGDGLEDVLIAVTNISNDSQPMSAQSKELSVWALGGGGGQMLWRKSLREPLISVQCGLQTGSSDPLHSSACVLISSGHMIAINASTGWTLWTTAVGHVVSHAVLLPDLQGDAFPDLLIATLPEDKVSDLALVLISGRSGALIGRPVNFNLTAQGKLIGPLLHETQTGAYYVMFGLGTVEAVSLSLIYSRATGQTAASRVRLKDPTWERLRKSNSSSLIHISSVSDPVDFLLSLVVGSCQRLRNLDGVSALNCSRSDWIVLSNSSRRLSVLRASDTRPIWSLSLASIHTCPAAGHFNDDGVPDLLVHQSANGADHGRCTGAEPVGGGVCVSSSGGGGFVGPDGVWPIGVPLLGGRSAGAAAERLQGGRAGPPQALPAPPELSHNPPGAQQHHRHCPQRRRELPGAAEGRVLHQCVVSALVRPRSRCSGAADAQSESSRRRRQDPTADRRRQTQLFPAAQVLQTPGLQTVTRAGLQRCRPHTD
uniref:FAM234A/B beta-propeller domain-containing protein n=1 Tax=Cyprinus carpio carpio TaxID=630221 RepID=A0A9J8AQE0_CYPCA